MQYKILTTIMSLGGAFSPVALKGLGLAWKYRVVIGKIAAVGTVLVAAYVHVFTSGYKKAETKYLHEIEVIEKANRAVIEDANAILRHAIQQNSVTDNTNEVIVNGLDQAAAVAPPNAPVALHAGSLRKLATIK